MNKQTIIDYVCDTPGNSNPAVLNTLLDEFGGSDKPTGVIEITENGIIDVEQYADANVNVSSAEPVINSITITENGTYEAVEEVDGYSPIIVNVPSGGSGYTKTVLWTNEDPMAPFAEDLIITFDEQIPPSELRNTYVYIAYCGAFGTFDRYYEGITTETILAEGDHEIAVNSILAWFNSGNFTNQLFAENSDDLGFRLVQVADTQVTIYNTVNTIYDQTGNFDDIKPYCGVPLQVSLITLN